MLRCLRCYINSHYRARAANVSFPSVCATFGAIYFAVFIISSDCLSIETGQEALTVVITLV